MCMRLGGTLNALDETFENVSALERLLLLFRRCCWLVACLSAIASRDRLNGVGKGLCGL